METILYLALGFWFIGFWMCDSCDTFQSVFFGILGGFVGFFLSSLFVNIVEDNLLQFFILFFGSVFGVRAGTNYAIANDYEKMINEAKAKQTGSATTKEYDDFAYAGNQNHEQHFHNTQAQSGAYAFDSSKFKNPNWTEKDAKMHAYYSGRCDDMSSSPEERIKSLKERIKLENKGKENLRQLPAPN